MRIIYNIKLDENKDGPYILATLPFAVFFGFTGYIFLKTCRPMPEEFLSGALFVLFGGIFMVGFFWAVKRMTLFRTVEITENSVTEKTFLLWHQLRERKIPLTMPHVLNHQIFQASMVFGGRLIETKWFFAGSTSCISFHSTNEQAKKIKAVIKLSDSTSKSQYGK